jgi:hypothetical protein
MAKLILVDRYFKWYKNNFLKLIIKELISLLNAK